MKLVDRIKRTYSYGLIFGYKRSLPEIFYWLTSSKKVSFSKFKKKLKETNLHPSARKETNLHSQRKILQAKKTLKLISLMPSVQFIGLTGSVAANNAKAEDDIDIFIITSKNTLWLTRLFVLLYLQYCGSRRSWSTPQNQQTNLICPNLWLDLNNLKLCTNKRNIYIAHEVLQVLPLFDKNNTYGSFVLSNRWVKKYLANAYSKRYRQYIKDKNIKQNIQKTNFFVLFLNCFSYCLQLLFMLPHYKGEEIGLGKAFFHDKRFAKNILLRQKRKTTL